MMRLFALYSITNTFYSVVDSIGLEPFVPWRRPQSKMSSNQEKAQCVIWFAESKSVTTVRRNYRRQYHKDPPSENSVRAWYRTFLDRGSVCDLPRSGCPSLFEESVDAVRESFVHSPQKSI